MVLRLDMVVQFCAKVQLFMQIYKGVGSQSAKSGIFFGLRS